MIQRFVYTGRVGKVSGRDDGWASLMLDLTGMSSVSQGGRAIREVIQVRARQHATIPEVSPAWCIEKDGALYINASGPEGMQIKVTPDYTALVENGADGAIMIPNPVSRPLKLLDTVDFVEAETVLDHIVSHFACDEQGRTFLKWYILSLFLYPLAQTHPVIRFRGDSASGKSTAAKIITTILYGDPNLISSTQAALYRSARRRPLTAIDNLEERDFHADPALQNFVLVSATGLEFAYSQAPPKLKGRFLTGRLS